MDIREFDFNVSTECKELMNAPPRFVTCTCVVTVVGLVHPPSEGGGVLQSLGLVLEDGRGELLQGAAQQVGCFLSPLMSGKLPAPR